MKSAAETLTRQQLDGDLPPWLFVTLTIVLWITYFALVKCQDRQQ